ncbi:hypothetical protein GC209_07390 [bacterium]|nr:hypothetical protein [bacterium]
MRKGMTGCLAAMAVLGSVWANGALAGDVPVEVSKLDGSKITLHVYPFLKPDELKTLRVVAKNRQALQIFIPGDKAHFSAMALAPDDGFMKDGAPVETAVALSDLPDAATAAANARAACDAKRGKKGKPCVTVLEVGPAS